MLNRGLNRGLNRPPPWAILAALFFAAMVALSWTGYLESDDFEYARAAEAWIAHFPLLGRSHWALRHLIVLPTALSFLAFGRSVAALELPMLLYAAAICLLQGLAVRRIGGGVAGAIAVLLTCSVPAFVTGASMVYSDLPELFFLLASAWSFHFAVEERRRALFLLSGLCAGCAFITRETTLVLFLLYFGLFLAGYGRRRDYAWIVLGCAAVLGLDTAALWLASGDPLWRMHVTLRGIAGDNPDTQGLQVNQGGLDRHGVIVAARWLQPLLELFANQQLGLLAWLGAPAAALLARGRTPAALRRPARLFALLAAAWFVMLCYGFWFLWLVPRYLMATECALAVPAALWLARALAAGHRLLPLAALAAVLGCGAVLTTAANHELMFGEQALAGFARAYPGPVDTDPETWCSAQWLLEGASAADRVFPRVPEPGVVYFFNPAPRRRLDRDWPVQSPPANAPLLAHAVQQPGPFARLLQGLGLDRRLPAALRDRLAPPPHTADALRITPATPPYPPGPDERILKALCAPIP